MTPHPPHLVKGGLELSLCLKIIVVSVFEEVDICKFTLQWVWLKFNVLQCCVHAGLPNQAKSCCGLILTVSFHRQ